MIDRVTARAHLLDCLRQIVPALKTIGTYDSHLWSACLEMFRSGDLSGFLDVFVDEIRNQLTRAFHAGAADVGVEQDEITATDYQHLEGWINSEYNYVLNLAQAIQDLHMSGATIGEFRSAIRWRIDLWANRYTEVLNEARVYFGGQVRLMWELGATEQHCPTCSALNGIVAFATEWDEANVRPQYPPNPFLSCGGWRCDCRLNPTQQRRSPRALNSILGIIINP